MYVLALAHGANTCSIPLINSTSDIVRICTAAATDYSGTGIYQKLNLISEVLRSIIIYSLTILIKRRKSCIRLGYYRNCTSLSHICNNIYHVLGTCRAVRSKCINTKRAKYNRSCCSIGSIQCSVSVKRQRCHNGCIRSNLLSRNNSCSCLLQAHHRLNDNKINARINTDLNLFLIDINQFLEIKRTHWLKLKTCHTDIGSHQYLLIQLRSIFRSQLKRHMNQCRVDIFELILQPVFLKLYPVSREGRSIQYITSGHGIFSHEASYYINIFTHPIFGAHSLGKSALLQIASTATV